MTLLFGGIITSCSIIAGDNLYVVTIVICEKILGLGTLKKTFYTFYFKNVCIRHYEVSLMYPWTPMDQQVTLPPTIRLYQGLFHSYSGALNTLTKMTPKMLSLG